MNCAELKEDIKRLGNARDNLVQKKIELDEEKSKKREAFETLSGVRALEDEVLEKYLPDFIEKNNFVQWRPEKAEPFETRELEQDRPLKVRTMTALDDGTVLVGGSDGVLKLYKRSSEEPSKWVAEDMRISNNRHECMLASCQLENGGVMVGSKMGELRVFSKDRRGNWKGSDPAFPVRGVEAITQLETGEVVVGISSGHLKIYNVMKDGMPMHDYNVWNAREGRPECGMVDVISMGKTSFVAGFVDGTVAIYEKAEGEWTPGLTFYPMGGDFRLKCMTKISDDEFMYGGEGGRFGVMKRRKRYDWDWEAQMIEWENDDNADIDAMVTLEDGSVAISRANGELELYKKDANDNWRAEDMVSIIGFADVMAVATDGTILTGDNYGTILAYSRKVRNLTDLKKNLKDIIRKAEE